jgi:hypothetical protein
MTTGELLPTEKCRVYSPAEVRVIIDRLSAYIDGPHSYYSLPDGSVGGGERVERAIERRQWWQDRLAEMEPPP